MQPTGLIGALFNGSTRIVVVYLVKASHRIRPAADARIVRQAVFMKVMGGNDVRCYDQSAVEARIDR
jgi:hypothetical protein